MSGMHSSFILKRHRTNNPHYDLIFNLESGFKAWIFPNRLPSISGERALAIESDEFIDISKSGVRDEYGIGDTEVIDMGDCYIKGIKESKIEFEANGNLLEGSFIFLVPGWGRFSKKRQWVLIKR